MMKFLKVMMLIALLLANYSATAHAFAKQHDCAGHMESGTSMADMDCCKDKAAKMQQCACDACGSCVSVAAALLTVTLAMTAPLPAVHYSPTASLLPRLALSKDLRPPDLRG